MPRYYAYDRPTKHEGHKVSVLDNVWPDRKTGPGVVYSSYVKVGLVDVPKGDAKVKVLLLMPGRDPETVEFGWGDSPIGRAAAAEGRVEVVSLSDVELRVWNEEAVFRG